MRNCTKSFGKGRYSRYAKTFSGEKCDCAFCQFAMSWYVSEYGYNAGAAGAQAGYVFNSNWMV